MELCMSNVYVAILALCICCVKSVDIHGKAKEVLEKECYGTNMGFSFSGSHEFHYESIRRRYTGCTYVHGNLEVTNLNNGNVSYDLSFLSSIKVVTGYVLLGLLNTEIIPLTSLRFIRGDQTVKLGGDRYSLVVALTSEGTPTFANPTPGLKELQLPRLKEILGGNVIFTQNPLLCYIHIINWKAITKNSVVFKEQAKQEHCGLCSRDCPVFEGRRHCWGRGRDMCQSLRAYECDPFCKGSCFEPGPSGCCHDQCAAGCSGPTDTQCELCKEYRHKDRCVTSCPARTYPVAAECREI